MNDQRRITKQIGILALVCVAIPVLYILSVGPAVFIYEKGGARHSWFSNAFQAFYSPLAQYVNEHHDDYPARLIAQYVEFCDGD